MALQIASSESNPDWQQLLAGAFRSGRELLAFLELDPAGIDALSEAASDFPCLVPLPYACRIEAGNPNDPLLLQVLPVALEMQQVAGYVADPLEEIAASPAPGLIHKYLGRVLLVTATTCAVNCRYCFRRHFPYEEHQPRSEELNAALDYIAADASITEVILSGGDPLMLSQRRLSGLVARLDAIPHLQRLRIHSRMPVVLPQRVDDQLCELLANSRLQTVLVHHANHAAELDSGVARANRLLREAGVQLLNQSVLLRGVNDDVAVLAALSERLFEQGVLPYYLHQLDPVQGAAHFQVEDDRALTLHRELQNSLSGYLVPKLVRERPGGLAKEALF